MMDGTANRHRGEIVTEIEGKTYRLCLTLGALAELETAFGDTDLLALAERFEKGRISASDAIKVIGAGLRGGGHVISNQELSCLQIDGGAGGYLRLVVDLLEATFSPANGPDAGKL
ncbi:Gene Transfer Agent (GTA) ORFG10 [hydrothermal vent metagenome]|uniref:Gene Transfer Agent (GTA) ORFG10 n=1 Tax=hydrothermal vent metagenome TaxID=652676 RepID=A0A3B0RVH7_9ZZZZ